MTDARHTVVLDYQEMIAAVRARIDLVKAPYSVLEDHAHVTEGYLAKTIGPAQFWGLVPAAGWPSDCQPCRG